MRSRLFRSLLVIVTVLLSAGLCRAGQLKAAPDRVNGIYRVEEKVHWRIDWQGDDAPPAVEYQLRQGGLTVVQEGVVKFYEGVAVLESGFEAPGAVLLWLKWKTADGKENRVLAGAVASPEQIALSAPRPEDFAAFWQAKLAELAKVPVDPQLEAVAVGLPEIAYWKLMLGNIHGSHVYGQLARPVADGKYPAMLITQWAGVYGLERKWVTDRAAEGWLVLNIEPHDLPFDRTADFYTQLKSAGGVLHDYPAIGNDSPETSYFLRMYLSCYRAADYLTSRPDWNGRTLVVTGGSQGGLQALVTAGLYPKVTAALAVVPAGCDMLGPLIGRKGGWPHWYGNVEGKDAAQVREASRYFDVANFAPAIQCPVLIAAGLVDETCPPAGILAAVNQITAPREVIIMPKAGHPGAGDAHKDYYDRSDRRWLPALRAGKPAPVNQP